MEDNPVSKTELEARFPTEESCFDYIFKTRWPGSPACPKCGSFRVWKYGTTLQCSECRGSIRFLSGTLFQDTHLPLLDWFRVMWFIVSQKNGINAMVLRHNFHLTYSTAWNILRKLRRAMAGSVDHPLEGSVEVDEAYIGGFKGGAKGMHASDKALVVLAAEFTDTSISRVRMKLIPSANAENLLGFIGGCVKPGTTVVTDGWKGYSGLEGNGYRHEVRQIAPGKKSLPHVNEIMNLLKSWLMDTLRGNPSPDYLEYYLDEYTFRYNNRHLKSGGEMFYRLLQLAVQTPPVIRDDVRAKKSEAISHDTLPAEINLETPSY
ncbi:MAG: IS1595 family transposase [Deltaproteobacteria bacterium]|jgi:transposase-like protein|nr:IS1595 family transposase [Deltaproteobacteria bacterium]